MTELPLIARGDHPARPEGGQVRGRDFSVITELGTGEALVSVLDEKGSPTPVERAFILPPQSRIGPLTAAERRARVKDSPLAGQYDESCDRESAYEMLKQRATNAAATVAPARAPAAGGLIEGLLGGTGRRQGWRRPWQRAPRVPSAARTDGNLCAACSARSWAADVKTGGSS